MINTSCWMLTKFLFCIQPSLTSQYCPSNYQQPPQWRTTHRWPGTNILQRHIFRAIHANFKNAIDGKRSAVFRGAMVVWGHVEYEVSLLFLVYGYTRSLKPHNRWYLMIYLSAGFWWSVISCCHIQSVSSRMHSFMVSNLLESSSVLTSRLRDNYEMHRINVGVRLSMLVIMYHDYQSVSRHLRVISYSLVLSS